MPIWFIGSSADWMDSAKQWIANPLFVAGLLIRLALLVLVTPHSVESWYVPFLEASINDFSLDPWKTWLNQSGSIMAFPYGYVMWFFFLPLTLLCKWAGLSLYPAYGITLLLADVALLAVFWKIAEEGAEKKRRLLIAYWLSPIVILASYLFGYNDLVPVLLLLLSLYAVKRNRMCLSGILCVAAVSAKLSMVLALPFFLVYLFNNRPVRQLLPRYLKGAVIAAVVLLLPFSLSSFGMNMLFNNPDVVKIYRLALPVGGNAVIYLIPLAYVLILYAAWRIKRLNFDLFYALLGIAFMLITLTVSASPGWFIWSIPLLVVYQLTGERMAFLLSSLFSGLYVVSYALLSPQWMNLLTGSGAFPFASPFPLVSLVYTGMVAAGVVLIVRIWREAITRNDYLRLSRKPFVLGIAGDSGAGKDTYANAIMGLFGRHSVTHLSGDDYHLWDRQKPTWQVMTHLNPLANNLEKFSGDLVALVDGKNVLVSHYDHHSGRMGHPFQVKSNDFILASGLHALYLPVLRECYNLSVYLDIDENLRRHFKIRRDVSQRGHSMERVLLSLQAREPDAEQFIRPQAKYADLVLSLQPIHHDMLANTADALTPRLRLLVRSRIGFNEATFSRVLVGFCGLHVDMQTYVDTAEVACMGEGEVSAQEIALSAQMICPH
ncbi:MAG: uridine kinase, partial [Burkholderiaceae bacterium]|nr:uridine kinase [Burkholderiaceae bacterium]